MSRYALRVRRGYPFQGDVIHLGRDCTSPEDAEHKRRTFRMEAQLEVVELDELGRPIEP